MRPEGGPDLAPYEDKKLSMSGLLFPGDRFVLDKGSVPVDKGTCGVDERGVIRKELIMSYRVAGYKAAQKKEFGEALRLVNVALAMDTNLCGTYIDRALVYGLQGDFAAGAADIERVKDGTCSDTQPLNFLMLEELGATLEKAGKTADAVGLYHMGLNSCDSDLCREAMETSLRRATGKQKTVEPGVPDTRHRISPVHDCPACPTNWDYCFRCFAKKDATCFFASVHAT